MKFEQYKPKESPEKTDMLALTASIWYIKYVAPRTAITRNASIRDIGKYEKKGWRPVYAYIANDKNQQN